VKIEAIGNIFFDISDTDFGITGNPALTLTSAVSRKTHTGVGDFDIPLPLVAPFGVECRDSAGNHQLVFTFSNAVVGGTANVSAGTGSISGPATFSGNTMTVNLASVTDMQAVAVTLTNVTDSFAQVMSDTVVTVNFLIGDVSGNKTVTASDLGEVKSQSGLLVSATNFRDDVNLSGTITASDVAQVKAASGNSIP
jgi:hypothetical protein